VPPGSVEVPSLCCALCRAEFREGEEILELPDFLADEAHPLYPYSGARVHRACYLFLDQRKAFAAAYNRIARTLGRESGVYLHLTSEGDLEFRPVDKPGPPPELRFPH
jgi:hypothetical protein